MNKLSIAAAIILGTVGTESAFAHAFLDHAVPAVGGKVKGSPAEVRIWFTEKLEPAFSSIKVMDATGKEVDRKDLRAEVGNASILHVSLFPVPPGTYKVTWKATSVDTHVTKGDFTFEVAP